MAKLRSLVLSIAIPVFVLPSARSRCAASEIDFAAPAVAKRITYLLCEGLAHTGTLRTETGEEVIRERLKNLDATISTQRGSSADYCDRGHLLTLLDRFPDARVDFTQSVALKRDNGLAYAGLALLDSNGDKSHALADMHQAVLYSPGSADYMLIRAVLYRLNNDCSQALYDLSQIDAMVSRNADVSCERALNFVWIASQSNLEAVLLDAAIAECTAALALDERCVRALCIRGYAYQKLLDPDRAESDFKRAIAVSPEYDAAYRHLSALYLSEKNHAEALANAEKSRQLTPLDARNHWTVGEWH